MLILWNIRKKDNGFAITIWNCNRNALFQDYTDIHNEVLWTCLMGPICVVSGRILPALHSCCHIIGWTVKASCHNLAWLAGQTHIRDISLNHGDLRTRPQSVLVLCVLYAWNHLVFKFFCFFNWWTLTRLGSCSPTTKTFQRVSQKSLYGRFCRILYTSLAVSSPGSPAWTSAHDVVFSDGDVHIHWGNFASLRRLVSCYSAPEEHPEPLCTLWPQRITDLNRRFIWTVQRLSEV